MKGKVGLYDLSAAGPDRSVDLLILRIPYGVAL